MGRYYCKLLRTDGVIERTHDGTAREHASSLAHCDDSPAFGRCIWNSQVWCASSSRYVYKVQLVSLCAKSEKPFRMGRLLLVLRCPPRHQQGPRAL